MSQSETDAKTAAEPAAQESGLTPAARRALAEAEARRRALRERQQGLPKELGGRGGNDPVRYGDWEVKGLTSDF